MALETHSDEVLVANIPINRVDFNKPDGVVRAALLILQREFYPEEDLSALLNKYRDLTKKDGLELVSSPETTQRGAEVYLFGRKEEPIGVLDLHFYRFDVIAPQLYLTENTDEKGKASYLSLKHFGEIINKEEKPEFVGELAYYVVAKQERGKRLGSLIFQQGIKRIKELINGKGLLLTIAKTNSTNPEAGRRVTEYLLHREKELNGLDKDRKVIIKGIPVSIEEIQRSTGVDCTGLNTERMNSHTSYLAKKHGMEFICYSKKLSSVFVTMLCK